MNAWADVVHTCGEMLRSHKDKTMPCAATQLDLEVITLREARQRRTNGTWFHSCMESDFLKWYKWTYLLNRNRRTDFKNKLTVTKGEMCVEGMINEDFAINIQTLLLLLLLLLLSHFSCVRPENQQGPTNTAQNFTQHSVITYMGKESEKEWTYAYVYESLCSIPETNPL